MRFRPSRAISCSPWSVTCRPLVSRNDGPSSQEYLSRSPRGMAGGPWDGPADARQLSPRPHGRRPLVLRVRKPIPRREKRAGLGAARRTPANVPLARTAVLTPTGTVNEAPELRGVGPCHSLLPEQHRALRVI